MAPESSKSNSDVSIAELIPHVSAMLPLMAAACLIVSMIWEVGYFIVVGTRFMPILTSADYLRASIFWLPLLVFSQLIGAIIGVELGKRSYQIKLQIERAPSKNAAIAYSNDKLIRYGFISSLIVSCIALSVNVRLVFLLFFPLILVFWIVSIILDRVSAPQCLYSPAIFYLSICIVAFNFGLISGGSDMVDGITMSIKGGVTDSVREVRIMRFVDRGAFFREPGTTFVEFVPWDELKGAKYKGAVHWTGQSGLQLLGLEAIKQPDEK